MPARKAAPLERHTDRGRRGGVGPLDDPPPEVVDRIVAAVAVNPGLTQRSYRSMLGHDNDLAWHAAFAAARDTGGCRLLRLCGYSDETPPEGRFTYWPPIKVCAELAAAADGEERDRLLRAMLTPDQEKIV